MEAAMFEKKDEDRRSFLGELIASAASMLLAGGLVLMPLPADAAKGGGSSVKRPPIVAKYGIKPPPIVAKYGVKPPPIVAKYGVKPPPVTPKYGIKPPAKPPRPPIVAMYGVKAPTKK
jgi:hypothetical protein